MVMPWECFYFIFALVEHVAPMCLQWPLGQLFIAAWAGRKRPVLSLSFFDANGPIIIQGNQSKCIKCHCLCHGLNFQIGWSPVE
jgi:hypothetical protein